MSPERVLSLLLRTPAAGVAALLPAGLELVQRGPWAFWLVTREGESECADRRGRVSYGLVAQAMDARAGVVRGVCVLRRGADDAAVRVETDEASRPSDSCFPTRLEVAAMLATGRVELEVQGTTLAIARRSGCISSREPTPVRVVEASLPYLAAMSPGGPVFEWAGWCDVPDEPLVREHRGLLGGGPLQHEHLPRGRRLRIAPCEAASGVALPARLHGGGAG